MQRALALPQPHEASRDRRRASAGPPPAMRWSMTPIARASRSARRRACCRCRADQLEQRRLRPRRCAQIAATIASAIARLRRGQRRRLVAAHQRDQRRQPVVEVVEALDVVDDPFVGLERAGDQRLGARLVDLDQPPVAQRPLRRHHVPGRIVERGEREREGRIRPAAVACARAHSAPKPVSSSIAAHSSSSCRSNSLRPSRWPARPAPAEARSRLAAASVAGGPSSSASMASDRRRVPAVSAVRGASSRREHASAERSPPAGASGWTRRRQPLRPAARPAAMDGAAKSAPSRAQRRERRSRDS